MADGIVVGKRGKGEILFFYPAEQVFGRVNAIGVISVQMEIKLIFGHCFGFLLKDRRRGRAWLKFEYAIRFGR